MSEDSKQLSVAELLARNGQEGSTSSGGGGRRRRGGRGISVAELTGDLPAIPDEGGRSAHSAPDEDSSEEPSHSPASGPITRYDPLAPPETATSHSDSSRHGAPADSGHAPSTNGSAPGSGRRRRRADADADSGTSEPSAEEPRPGSRAARRRAAEAAEAAETAAAAEAAESAAAQEAAAAREAAAAQEAATSAEQGPATALWQSPPAPGQSGPMKPAGSVVPDQAMGQPAPGAEPPGGPETTAWSPGGPDAGAADSRPQLPRRTRTNGASTELPAWSARRHFPDKPESGAEPQRVPDADSAPTATWSLAELDQQRPPAPPPTGAMRAPAAPDRNGMGSWGKRNDKPAAMPPLAPGPAPAAAAQPKLVDNPNNPDLYATDVYAPVTGDQELIDDDDFEFDDEDDDESESVVARTMALWNEKFDAAKAKMARSDAGERAVGAGSSGSSQESEANRKQWLVLAGQSVGAAVIGMLLFKGFERMWEVLPWVALALAMVVVLGLVALVRVLRRTDDIFSTVIAVVVGIFVTLSPLAFLLSTG